jgi:hypothetical protein
METMSRFKSLFVKLWSIKTIPAVIFTFGYFQSPSVENTIACMTAWALVVGFRYAEKVSGLVKGK